MNGPDMIVLRALGALLSYPGAEMRAALPEIAEMLRGSPLMAPDDRAAVLALIDLLRSADPLWAEERYVELFDRGRATSLHLFEHVHGEARDRGEAMVELKEIYERAGLRLHAQELPDYLPVVLEYLSCRSLAEARDMLGDCAHILRAIGGALRQRGSSYGTIFTALLGIIGEADAGEEAATSRRLATPEDIDRDWEELPAFAPESGPTGARPGRRTER